MPPILERDMPSGGGGSVSRKESIFGGASRMVPMKRINFGGASRIIPTKRTYFGGAYATSYLFKNDHSKSASF